MTQGQQTDSPAVTPVTDRFEEIMLQMCRTEREREIMLQFQRRMPRTIYEVYVDDNEKYWWYDLVTGDAVFERPLNSIVLNPLTDRSASG